MRKLNFGDESGEILDEGFKALQAELEPYRWDAHDEKEEFNHGYEIITIN